jgi:hypothetical protein
MSTERAGTTGGIETVIAQIVRGDWLGFLPAGLREPAARAALQMLAAAAVLLVFAPVADSHGDAYLEATFARTLAALAATRGLDSAISLAQSSEVSFSFGPGGSLGIGQALDPINDLVEQYGALLLTSTTALGVQRLAMQIGRTLGWWMFLPALAALGVAAACGNDARRGAIGWSDSGVAARFLESNYQQATAAVTATTEKLEQAEADDRDRPWYERYNPVDVIGAKAKQLYETLAGVGESIVNLAIYFTISTIVLPLGTLWLLSRLSGAFFAGRGGG